MNRFEILVVGHIETRWARALGAEVVRHLPDGRTVLLAAAVDTAATYGLIARLRDAGIELVSINPVPLEPRQEAPDASG